MKTPKISVIMSAYNAEKYIAEAIESILNQTFKDFEFIIINDSSTDDSLKIIKKYKNKDRRIVLINNKKNIGLTKSLNKGLKIAKGKYIARMDDDDISLSNRFQIQFNFLKKNKEIFLVGAGTIIINKNGKCIKKSIPIANRFKIKNILNKKNFFYHSTIMFRNIHKIFYREKMLYVEDYDLYLRLIDKGYSLTNIKKPLLKYRISDNSMTHSNSIPKQLLFIEKAIEFHNQRLGSGSDKYDSFNPISILKMDYNKSNNKDVLKYLIKSAFKVNDFLETRNICKRYFKNYGIFNIVPFYYLITFLGKKYQKNSLKIPTVKRS